jgi:hydrogenase 3 maturation protease
MDLRQQLEKVLCGRICVIGVGNTEYGDDSCGVCLAARLAAGGISDVTSAGNTPERYLGPVAESKFDRVLFLDAVDVGTAPGSVVLLNSSEMSTRFPQVSTHKISLGLLARWAEENGVGEAWLLGVQAESVTAGQDLSPTLQTTVDFLADLLLEVLTNSQAAPHAKTSSAGVNS